MEDIEFKVGDTVRMTDRIMRVTGNLTEIEPIGSCSERDLPKYWVNRNGKLYWYSGDKLQLIKSK